MVLDDAIWSGTITGRPEYLSVQQVRGPGPGQCWQRMAAITWPLDQFGLIVGRDRLGENAAHQKWLSGAWAIASASCCPWALAGC